jgi:hypothetical protein
LCAGSRSVRSTTFAAASTRLDRLNAVVGTFRGLIALAGGDDLSVGGLEVEPKLAGFVRADLELGCQGSSP